MPGSQHWVLVIAPSLQMAFFSMDAFYLTNLGIFIINEG
jgi:hypothetical protein